MWTRNNVTFVWFVWFTWRKESHSIYNLSVSQALSITSRRCWNDLQGRGFWDNSSGQTPSLSGKYSHPAFAPCYLHCSEGSGLCSQVPGQHLLLCVHLGNWRPQTTKQTATQVFKILAHQWQWMYQASNSRAKWKITVLWFYFVDWSRFPSGHTHRTALSSKRRVIPQHSQGWAVTGERLSEPPKTCLGWQSAPK